MALKPVSHRDLIRRFRVLGFTGPYSGGRHQFMTKGTLRIRIPNPHRGDIHVGLLGRILRQAGISEDDWNQA